VRNFCCYVVDVCSNFAIVGLGSVFCINVTSRKSLAVSGGEDDVAYVWSMLNGDIVFKCTGLCSEFVLYSVEVTLSIYHIVRSLILGMNAGVGTDVLFVASTY